jgi:di/tricarboxylate transporter
VHLVANHIISFFVIFFVSSRWFVFSPIFSLIKQQQEQNSGNTIGIAMNETCPCPHPSPSSSVLFRDLQQEDNNDTTTSSPTLTPTKETYELWEIIYTSIVLLLMFVALISDRIGADSVMMIALTLYMAAGIVSVEEGVAGFSNEGLLTVMALFVVADGISKTGALDWYMSKLLGRPKTVASAQLRLMVPVSIVSAFLK